jgi:hypothetical protein
VQKQPEEITDDEFKFWTQHDKHWAWYMFLLGSKVSDIVIMIGRTEDQFKQWVDKICSGGTTVTTHPFPLLDHKPYVEWTPRHLKLLRKMRDSRLEFSEACRLLERKPESVKKQLKQL